MTRIESDKAIINKPAEEVFDFLSDLNNFEKLMPEQIVNWQSSEDECSFTIKGTGTLAMRISERIPNTEIRILRNGEAPFDFVLTCLIDETEDSQCRLQMIFDAQLNAFLRMVAERPLTNFLNMLVHRFQQLNA